jgi:L-histidine Nalpha-methyltransferase
LRRDVFDGLQKTPKSLPPKWFYDSVGSDLFDQITRLPEYYPTRAEAEILRASSVEIASASQADTLVELGAGTSEKTRLLLNALRDRGSLRGFVPFDVDAAMLSATATAIQREYPGIEIKAVCGDFDDRKPDTATARGFPRHLGCGDAARGQPAAGHRSGQGHRPAGARL